MDALGPDLHAREKDVRLDVLWKIAESQKTILPYPGVTNGCIRLVMPVVFMSRQSYICRVASIHALRKVIRVVVLGSGGR